MNALAPKRPDGRDEHYYQKFESASYGQLAWEFRRGNLDFQVACDLPLALTTHSLRG